MGIQYFDEIDGRKPQQGASAVDSKPPITGDYRSAGEGAELEEG